jgi:hypothetical protein
VISAPQSAQRNVASGDTLVRGALGPHHPAARAFLRDNPSCVELITRLLALATRGLPLMYRPEVRGFAFTRKWRRGALRLYGQSLRYEAIVLLGAHRADEATQRCLLAGDTAAQRAERLVRNLPSVRNLGDAALVTWAAAECGSSATPEAARHLCEFLRRDSAGFTVEHAWVLSALTAARSALELCAEILSTRERLLRCFSNSALVFAHWLAPRFGSRLRRHVACFADQVYPIQALARDYAASGDPRSLEIASSCARQICRLQGPAGQWWWHYDIRTGDVVEGYPVYSVHQDAMAPMALFDLVEAGGPNLSTAIMHGLEWLMRCPEVGRPLVADDLALIWRSVRRADLGKCVRKLRAAACRLAKSVWLPVLDRVFPPSAVDYEDRPYHLGWILYTWLGKAP